jgi:predicted lipid-binding transport protein (Tim44 family)
MVRFLTLLIAVMLLVPFVDEAEAKRFGGGRSFGSKPSQSQPASQPRQTNQQTTQRDAGSQQQATQAAPGAAPRAGGMMGGMLGGLLMGGLIGSLLMGGGLGGGIGLVEMLLIGGGIYLLFRVLRSRRSAMEPATATAGVPAGGSPAWGGEWERLRSSGPAQGQPQNEPQAVNVPEGFDSEDFIEGAKALYVRMQDSWSSRDLEDIATFATPGLMKEVRRQAEEDDDRHRTEVLLVNARLLEVRREGDKSTVTVYFDVLMREDPSQSQSSQVREVWHFVRNEAMENDSWRLDGIQQLEQ